MQLATILIVQTVESRKDILYAMQVRSHIFQVLDGSEQTANRAKTSSDTYLLNELVCEYLDFQGYTATKSVFCKEGQIGQQTLPRGFVEDRVGLSPGGGASQLPILYSLLRRQQLQTKVDKGCS